MKKFIYFVMALMLVMMPVTVSATTTSNEKNLYDLTVKAQVTNNGEITITLSDVGANSYDIYRNGEKIATTTSLKYVDKDLDVSKLYSYYVIAYKDNDNSGIKYVDNSLYPLKSIAKPKFTISKSKNSSTGLDFKITVVDGGNFYELYEVVNGKYILINNAYYYNNDDKTVTMNSYSNKYGKHTFAVRAKNMNANIYSGYTTITYTYKPESPVVKIKAINYDQNELTIERPQTYYVDYNIKVHIYRSTDNKKFTKIKTISKIRTYEDTIYTDKIKDAKLGKTYYYKAVFEYEGTKSNYGKVAKIKSALAAPKFEIYNSYNDAQTIEILNTGKNVKYEIYQATKKNGKYKKVCDTGKSKCDVKATINKNYYYKVRAYMKVNGKKITSKYSSIKNLKLEMKSYDNYAKEEVKLASYYNTYDNYTYVGRNYGAPVYYNNYAEATIKSVKMTKKSGGNTSKFEMAITYKNKKSDKKKTLQIYVTFYNYDYSKAYTVTLNEKFVKGTKKNATSKYTIRIPRWAMFYEID